MQEPAFIPASPGFEPEWVLYRRLWKCVHVCVCCVWGGDLCTGKFKFLLHVYKFISSIFSGLSKAALLKKRVSVVSCIIHLGLPQFLSVTDAAFR